MAQKRFGPTRGAGTVVVETDGEKPIEPGALGWAGYAGIMEKGPVGELIVAQNKSAFKRICGGVIDDSVLPDCASDFYKLAAGAGGLLLVRVTDGNEEQASLTLYTREDPEEGRVAMGRIKAHNGGRWGGKESYLTGEMPAGAGTDLTNTTITTGVTMVENEYKGGWAELPDVPNVRYEVTGNTAAGVITVASDATMADDYAAAAGTSDRFYVYLENEDKAVSVVIEDGEDSPDTEFSLSVYVDGAFVRKYSNLSTNPAEPNYWVSLINDDTSNWEIEAEDLVTGAHVAATRPANVYGTINTVTETVLTADVHGVAINSPTSANPTTVLAALTALMLPQVITVTVLAGALTGTAVSDRFGTLGLVTLGTPFVPDNKYTPGFTITNGATVLAEDDTVTIDFFPMKADALIGGFLYPDKVNAKRERYRITDNNHSTITVAAGSDLTASGTAGDQFMVVAPIELTGGIDGNAGVVDADYLEQAWNVDSSPFNRVEDRNMGLIKFATPGKTSTTIQQGGVAYAEAKNHQYRYEAASSVLTEEAIIALVNDTLGRSDYAVIAFPSYGSVVDPEATTSGKLKEVPLTGMIHGREAAYTKAWNGYHKAQAGVDAKLPGLLKIPTGETILDEERLNPVGIQVIKKKRGNFVIWGDRTLYTDPNWKWKHQRELMSYYEQVLRESFDWIAFAINDPVEQIKALSALRNFFKPEWQPKRALRGKTFEAAAVIKIDSENNTDATAADGDMFADIALKLADTVERFIIRVGKQGIFDEVA